MPHGSQGAIAAALAVARAHGLHCREPVVLREAWHVLVHLRPPAYVGWVTASMLTALPRRPELADAIEARVHWLSQR
jgi:hypothetical protein